MAKKMPVVGWGRYPKSEGPVYRPEKRRGVEEVLRCGEHATFLARGLGRSYGDAALNTGGALINTTRLDRMLAFDASTGTLCCEAGVSFTDIIDTFLPRGWFLPVTPGTRFITVGGAIAHDVHGKNHHRDGTFGQWVDWFDLLIPAGDTLRCSRTENNDVFWATLGGAGLTGVMLTAQFRLLRVESAWWEVDYFKAKNIEEVLSAIESTEAEYPYSVAWVDCLAKGASLGRSVLMNGRNAPASAIQRQDPLALPRKRAKRIPLDFPAFVLNPWSIRAFNTVFYGKAATRNGVLVDFDSYFYPLDFLHDWNRLYGKRGFIQYQFVVPMNQRHGLIDLLEMVSASGRASFLAVLKKFGPANEGLLSFPFEGFTLTLDIAMRDGLVNFLHQLDRKLLDHNGRLYLAKDAAMTPATFRAMYPRFEEFKALKHRLDPNGRLVSDQARRVGLVET
ncbi:MAG: FAD-binding oxidoreductase [Candidatus Hydrogenedentales bacterium]